MDFQSLKEYFKNRHSYRRFSVTPPDDALIDEIIELAMHAPTTGNMQLYSVIVTRDAEMLARLRPTHFNQPAATNAPILLTVCADFNRFSRWCELSRAKPGYDNFLSFTSAMLDATIISQQIVTIAEMMGLGTCYLGTVTYNADLISDILDLPELVIPVACIALGWPEGKAEETERLPLEAVRFHEHYFRPTDEEILTLYKAKDEFPPNSKFVEENGKETLAQVFTDVRYPREMNEEFSRKFLKLLQDKGFLKN